MGILTQKQERQRRAQLAKIHIAKKSLALDDDTYRDLLDAEFGKRSAGNLTLAQLDRLIGIFQGWGWESDPKRQAAALRNRARELASKIQGGPRRLQGLCRNICGVQRLEWCHDVAKLERLLAALGRIERSGE